MFKIYKKCEKCIDNPKGIIEIYNLSEYNNPFMLCLSSDEKNDNSIFGVIKEGARAARVCTSDEFASGYKIDDMQVDFLGIKYFNENGHNNNLVDDFIYPYLKKGDIKVQARKINFFTYCNATRVYVELEKRLREKLISDGYDDKSIEEILSQISLISIASEVDITNIYASTILFKDINDYYIYDYISKTSSKKMASLGRNTYLGYLRNNGPVIFAFNATGKHSLKEYFKNGNLVKSSLCAVTSFLLENSIHSAKIGEHIPISSRMLLKMALRYNSEFEDCDALLHKLEEEITYDGASKYVKEEYENTLLI